MNPVRHTILGLFFLGTLFALGFSTIYLGDFRWMSERSVYPVFFENVAGLRAGDPVLVYGVPLGEVESVEFTDASEAAQRLRVVLAMDRPLDLRADHRIDISDQSLLGGKRVEIELGVGEPAGDGPLLGHAAGNALRSVQDLIDENREGVRNIVDNLEGVTGRLNAGGPLLTSLIGEESTEALDQAIASIRDVTGKLNTGDGSLAQFINKPDLHDKTLGFMDSGGVLFNTVVEGNGALPRLLREPEVYDNLKAATESVKAILERVETGQGLAGKLLTERSDPLFADIESVASSWRNISAGLVEGKGLLGKILQDEEMAAQAKTLVAEASSVAAGLSSMVEDVRAGRGVLGYLLSDDEARREVARIVNLVVGALEDAREAAPVSSFASFLFGQL